MSPWLALIALGAFHGLNPGMGWLFALSLGLQQRRARVIWVSLLPIAAGHALAIGIAVLAVVLGLQYISLDQMQWVTAIALLLLGAYKLRNYYRHPRWAGMKVGIGDLFFWSFLMATAHGAGLMVAPVLLGLADHESAHAGHVMPRGEDMLLAVTLHSLVMLLTMGLAAWVVYRKLGLAILRQHWINFDLIWAVSLLVVGTVALLVAL